jgi:hypothetical protein
MAEIKDITVNITINGTLDADIIAEEVKHHLRREIERVGVKTEVAKPAPLKVGDYAKVVADESKVAENGDVFEITHTNYVGCGTVFPYNGKRVTDGKVEQFYDREIIRATNEEVSKAKRQGELKAVAEKWSNIGRKPNEFKVGDAVRYKKAFTTVVVAIPGLIRINQSNHVDKHISVRPEDLSLVFPTEARFE